MPYSLRTLLPAFAFLVLASSFAVNASAEDALRAVGSSTVYPFITVVAEEFGKKTGNKTPIIEATGTGGGFKLFCAGNGADTPSIANASRQVKSSELELCKKNKVEAPIEIKIGYDGLVFAHSVKAPQYNVTRKDLFLALARQVPSQGKLVDNFYKRWSDVSALLPNVAIEVYGPPPTSGTRDSFVESVMEHSCVQLKEFKDAYPDDKERAKSCKLLREDGKFIEAGENDNLTVQKLSNNPTAIGIFGYSFLAENMETVQGSKVEGVSPEFETIATGKYPVSRPLYVYIKRSHLADNPALKAFVAELLSDASLGNEGYLATKGLVPMKPDERTSMRQAVLGQINGTQGNNSTSPSQENSPQGGFNSQSDYNQDSFGNSQNRNQPIYGGRQNKY